MTCQWSCSHNLCNLCIWYTDYACTCHMTYAKAMISRHHFNWEPTNSASPGQYANSWRDLNLQYLSPRHFHFKSGAAQAWKTFIMASRPELKVTISNGFSTNHQANHILSSTTRAVSFASSSLYQMLTKTQSASLIEAIGTLPMAKMPTISQRL